MKFHPFSLLIRCTILVAALLLTLHGCADMPIVEPPPGEDKPIGEAMVVLGPYLTSQDGMQPFLRFVSSRRTVAGVQSLASTKKYINRQGSFSLFHALAIPELEQHTKLYELWLGDQDAGTYGIRGLPRSGTATSIGFAGGSVLNGRLNGVGNQLRRLVPSAIVFTSPPFPGGMPDAPVDWESQFFAPLGDKVALGPMWFVPGAGLPKDLFPENAKEGGYWKRDLGALRLIGIDARSFSFESSRNAVMDRLRADLDPQHINRAWTVVVLSRSAFDAHIGDGRILGALGGILEQGGVDLVIGHGDYYMRTHPFMANGRGQTRYITIADSPVNAPDAMSSRDYVAAISGTPHIARLWVDDGGLEWQVLDLAGKPIDVLTLTVDRPHLDAPMSTELALQDASANLSLQREILKITRQAAQADNKPGQDLKLSLNFANPTNQIFSGVMRWSLPGGADDWRIEPMEMPFTLQPGQGAAARFLVRPGNPAAPPLLTAFAQDIGSSTEPLIVTKRKYYDVQKSPESIRLDARFRDKSYWRTLPVLTGFETAVGQPAVSPTEGRVTADKDGLVIALSMAAKNASQVNPPAANPDSDRDTRVLEDESIEVYLDPNRDGREFYRFAINPRNVILDSSSRGGLSYNPSWRHVTRFGRVGDIETWDVEMRIPWESLGQANMPAPGTEWGMQVVRRDYAGLRQDTGRRRGRNWVPPDPQVSEWVRTGGDNTRPGLYGVLRFGDLSEAPEAADTGRRAPAPGVLIRGRQDAPLPGRLPMGGPGGFIPPPSGPVVEPPPPDMIP